jgi:hypothetical protein
MTSKNSASGDAIKVHQGWKAWLYPQHLFPSRVMRMNRFFLHPEYNTSFRRGCSHGNSIKRDVINVINRSSRFCAEAEFLDETQTKLLTVFLLVIHSHIYSFPLRFLFLQTHTTVYSFYSSANVHCKGERRKT